MGILIDKRVCIGANLYAAMTKANVDAEQKAQEKPYADAVLAEVLAMAEENCLEGSYKILDEKGAELQAMYEGASPKDDTDKIQYILKSKGKSDDKASSQLDVKYVVDDKTGERMIQLKYDKDDKKFPCPHTQWAEIRELEEAGGDEDEEELQDQKDDFNKNKPGFFARMKNKVTG